jgi:hypothetical protein
MKLEERIAKVEQIGNKFLSFINNLGSNANGSHRWSTLEGVVMSNRRLLRRKAASKYLDDVHGIPRAPSTLAKLAVIGGGPTFRRVGRVPLYSTDDLDDWVASKLSAPIAIDIGRNLIEQQNDLPGRAARFGR